MKEATVVLAAYRESLTRAMEHPEFPAALGRGDRSPPMAVHGTASVSPDITAHFRQAWPWSRLYLGVRVRVFRDAAQHGHWHDDFRTTIRASRWGSLEGVPEGLLKAAVGRVMRGVEGEVLRQQAVRNLDALCKPYVGDDAFVSAVERQEREWGLSDYGSLSVEDCQRWTRWVREWADNR